MNSTPTDDSAAPAAPKFHTANADGYYPDAEQIFVPMPVGNICHFLLVHREDGFLSGYKCFIRAPKNRVEKLPIACADSHPSREEALAESFDAAWKFFTGHKPALAYLQSWACATLGMVTALAKTDVEFQHLAEESGKGLTDQSVGNVLAALDAQPVIIKLDGTASEKKPELDSPSLPVVVLPVEAAPAEVRRSRFDSIAVADIERGNNPRKNRSEEKLIELMESIRGQGELLQPIAVRDMGDPFTANIGKRYRLIFGEGRWIAIQRLGWPMIDAKVYTGVSDAEARAKALVENLQREDMNAMDEAEGFAELQADGWTKDQMVQKTGKVERTISRALSLVKLPDDVRDLIRDNKLSARQARALVRWVAAPHNEGDFISRPEVCSIIAQTAAEFDISADRLSTGVPPEAVKALRAAKLLVEIPSSYLGDVEIGEVYFRVGDGIYTFDAAAWKARKKDVDAQEKAIIAEARDRANSKLLNKVSVPVKDLVKGGVEYDTLPVEDERYADFLPEGAIATGIGKDNSEVMLVVNPDALAQLKIKEALALHDDLTAVLEAAHVRATEKIAKLKKIGAREMAFIAEVICPPNGFCVPITRMDFEMQKIRMPKDFFGPNAEVTRESLAKLDPVDLCRLLLQARVQIVREEQGYDDSTAEEIDMLRWILETPKLGLIQEDEKARAKLLERLSAELWPKTAAMPAPIVEKPAAKKPAKNSRKK